MHCLLLGWVFLCIWQRVAGSTKDAPHPHSGVLAPYDGKPIQTQLSAEELQTLERGESIICKERAGVSGRGIVIQDICAPPSVCSGKIRDFLRYPSMVPHVKDVQIYEEYKLSNGTARTFAKFDVGAMGVRIGYFLKLTHEPKYDTLTWTLDYRYRSDIDDSVGHWQVMNHPAKSGWSRVLYSTKVKLYPWIPEFMVGYLTSKALTESTSWVKREAERESKMQPSPASKEDAAVASEPARKGWGWSLSWIRGRSGPRT